jgi:hypothetical protein
MYFPKPILEALRRRRQGVRCGTCDSCQETSVQNRMIHNFDQALCYKPARLLDRSSACSTKPVDEVENPVRDGTRAAPTSPLRRAEQYNPGVWLRVRTRVWERRREGVCSLGYDPRPKLSLLRVGMMKLLDQDLLKTPPQAAPTGGLLADMSKIGKIEMQLAISEHARFRPQNARTCRPKLVITHTKLLARKPRYAIYKTVMQGKRQWGGGGCHALTPIRVVLARRAGVNPPRASPPNPPCASPLNPRWRRAASSGARAGGGRERYVPADAHGAGEEEEREARGLGHAPCCDVDGAQCVNIYPNVRPRKRSPGLAVVRTAHAVSPGPFTSARISSSSHRRHLRSLPLIVVI